MDAGLHHLLEVFDFLNRQSKSGCGNKRIACAALEPRVAGKNVSFLSAAVMELMSGRDKAVEEVVARVAVLNLLVEELLQR